MNIYINFYCGTQRIHSRELIKADDSKPGLRATAFEFGTSGIVSSFMSDEISRQYGEINVNGRLFKLEDVPKTYRVVNNVGNIDLHYKEVLLPDVEPDPKQLELLTAVLLSGQDPKSFTDHKVIDRAIVSAELIRKKVSQYYIDNKK